MPSSSWDFFQCSLPLFLLLYILYLASVLSLCFSGCHFQSLFSSYPFPLLTHSELSIAASLPHFPSSPLSTPPSFLPACSLAPCLSSPSLPPSLNLLSYFMAAFHFLHPLLSSRPPHPTPPHPSRSLFPCSSPLSLPLPHSVSLCLSLSVTVGYRSAGRLG